MPFLLPELLPKSVPKSVSKSLRESLPKSPLSRSQMPDALRKIPNQLANRFIEIFCYTVGREPYKSGGLETYGEGTVVYG